MTWGKLVRYPAPGLVYRRIRDYSTDIHIIHRVFHRKRRYTALFAGDFHISALWIGGIQRDLPTTWHQECQNIHRLKSLNWNKSACFGKSRGNLGQNRERFEKLRREKASCTPLCAGRYEENAHSLMVHGYWQYTTDYGLKRMKRRTKNETRKSMYGKRKEI